eukprot:CAMPEP_0114997042 /NCGR_PEP_ID=MMETSP0216-20121206/14670_1 /TAXON_ID=223996 /ORGANISM="Protocruzia adherens, Strain Boccale" /LENGTH=562 /DNA_ID=CAMNT_0002361361 /DNA_START=149 /DNA_END=1837 /DNA_ORIENTATION=+
MSFAPKKREEKLPDFDKQKAKLSPKRMDRGRNEEEYTPVSHGEAFSPDEVARVSQRIQLLEDAISKLELQQDTFRPLLKLIDNVPSILKMENNMKTLYKKNNELDDKINSAEQTTREWKENLENLYLKTNQSLNEEITQRSQDHKNLVNELLELDGNHKQLELETQMAIKAAEVRMKEEVITLASDFEQKVEKQRQEFNRALVETQSKLETDIEMHRDETSTMQGKMSDLESEYNGRLAKMEGSISPAFDNLANRRKIDYEDLKTWLLEEMDQRIQLGVEKLKSDFEDKFKGTNLRTNQDIQTMKHEIEQIKDIVHQIKLSKYNDGETYVDDGMSPSEKKLEMKGVETKMLLDELENYCSQTADKINVGIKKMEEDLDQQAEIIRKSVMEVVEKKQADDDIQELILEIQGDFDEHMNMLQKDLKKIKMDVSSRKDKTAIDLYRIQEHFQVIEDLKDQTKKAAMSQSVTERKTQISTTLKQETQKVEALKQQFEKLRGDIEKTNLFLGGQSDDLDNAMRHNSKDLDKQLADAAQGNLPVEVSHIESKAGQDDDDPEFEDDAFD